MQTYMLYSRSMEKSEKKNMGEMRELTRESQTTIDIGKTGEGRHKRWADESYFEVPRWHYVGSIVCVCLRESLSIQTLTIYDSNQQKIEAQMN